MEKKKLWLIIASAVVAICLIITIIFFALKPDKGLLVSLNYSENFNNTIDNNYKPVSYGNLGFVKNGIIGGALEFINGHLEISGSEDVELSDSFSFATWIKVTGKASIDPIIFCRKASDGNKVTGPVNIHFSDDYSFLRTDITFEAPSGEYFSHSFLSKQLWRDETDHSMWHHFCVVFNKDTLYYYVDGSLLCSEVLPDDMKIYNSIANNSKVFCIGAGQFDAMYSILDETKFYNTAITAEEIKNLYEMALTEYDHTLILKPYSDEAIFNGKTEKLPVAITRDKQTERLMVPLRYVIDKMGGTISWDADDGYGRADIVLKDTEISVWYMDTNALANHKYCKLDAYPQDINDVMCVPIRFVAEELGASVNWNEEKEEVTIMF